MHHMCSVARSVVKDNAKVEFEKHSFHGVSYMWIALPIPSDMSYISYLSAFLKDLESSENVLGRQERGGCTY